MSLFFRKRKSNTAELNLATLQIQLDECHARGEFLLRSVRSLIWLAREAAVEIQELDAEGFRTKLNTLSEQFTPETPVKKLEQALEEGCKGSRGYYEKSKEHIAARERELKDIIDLLTKGLAALNADNIQFTKRVHDHSSKLAAIQRLDDIKQLKDALGHEIDQVKQDIRRKQERDAEVLQNLSSRVGTLHEELEQARIVSLTDSLTGIHNRMAFDRYIHEQAERCAALGESFCLLMVDVDDFKTINDTHGHQVGDRVLAALAQRCREVLRRDDFVARYGGEEFVIVMPGAALKNARKKALNLCKTISNVSYEAPDLPGQPKLNFTISVGVSGCQRKDRATDVIERADRALYQAKRSGKNRVVIESEVAVPDKEPEES